MVAIVIDDEVLSAEHISRLLINTGLTVYSFTNPYEALENMQKSNPDVVFLDIEMPGMNGLEIAEMIQAFDMDCEVIFITGHNQYAIEAFDVNALDYLLKPITPRQVTRAMDRVIKRRGSRVTSANENQNLKNVIKISLFGKMSVHTGNEKKSVRFLTVKSAEVFCFMLMHKGEEVSKWRLIDAIWPDKDLDKGDINLRSTVSRLNKTFRENNIKVSMNSTRNGYQLEVLEKSMEVDAFLLEEIASDRYEINEGNMILCENSILSYNDMLFEDFDNEWCVMFRNVYHRYFRMGAQKLIDYYFKVQMDPLKSLNIIERIIKYEPYDDKIRQLALKLNYQIAGKNGASKYYGEYLDLIKKDLGLEPSEELINYYKSIVQNFYL